MIHLKRASSHKAIDQLERSTRHGREIFKELSQAIARGEERESRQPYRYRKQPHGEVWT